MKDNINIEIRKYLRANPHLTDDIIAEKFEVSTRSVSANKSHITMGTDTENPQERAKAVKRIYKKGLSLIKTKSYELRIDEDGQYSRADFTSKIISKISDNQAKDIMLTELRHKN